MFSLRAPGTSAASFSCAAFDLDGTLYFGDTLAEGAADLLDAVARTGATVIFFTNNSMKTRDAVVGKLVGMGLPASRSNTYTSGSAVGGYLVERGIRTVALVGSEGLAEELAAAGVSVTDEGGDAEALIVGLIPGFDFSSPPGILGGLPDDIPLIAANMDMTYPVEVDRLRPGCGAIVRAVEGWMGRPADSVVGKPGTFMLDLLCAEHGVRRGEVLVVGDSLDSDIAMARAAGCHSVLIDSAGNAGEVGDTVVVRDLRELRSLLSGPGGHREGSRS